MKQRILSVLLAIVMVVSVLPVGAVPVAAAEFSYVNENNTVETADNCMVITQDSRRLSSGWYIVDSDVTISSRLEIGGTVNLILADGATLNVSGIRLHTGNTLKIYGQSQGTGRLIATSIADRSAGIGGDYGVSAGVAGSCGDLYVYGGNVEATGRAGGAGIGGGASKINVAMDGKDGLPGGNGGNIYIYGGTVTARGGAGAAGVGGGAGNNGNTNRSTQPGGKGSSGGNGGNVYLYGGTLTATGGEGAADIGGGKGGSGGSGGSYTYDSWQGKVSPGNGGDGGNGGASGSVTLSGTTAKLHGSIGGGTGGAGGAAGQDMAGTVISFVRPGSNGSVGQSPVIFLANGAAAPEDIAEDAMVVNTTSGGNGALRAAYNASLAAVTFIPEPDKNYMFDSYESDGLVIEAHQTAFAAGTYTVQAKFVDKPHAHDDGTVFTEWTATSGSLTNGDYFLAESNAAPLTADIIIPAGETVSLCLNGNILSMGTCSITNNGTLTICDCADGGKITNTTNWDGVVTNNGVFYLMGGTLEDTQTYGLFNEGTATISGGTLFGNASGIRNRSNGNLTITGGNVTCGTSGIGLQTESATDVIISGGKFSGQYAFSTNAKATGDIYISGGTFEGVDSGINHRGTGAVYVSDGVITGRYGIYNNATGNVHVSGGTVTATGSWGIYNGKTGKITVSGGTVTSQKHGIYNGGDGFVEMTGGTVTGIEQTGISNHGSGSVTVSGGTIIAKTAGISAYESGSVFFDKAQIDSAGAGISVYKGSLTVAGGTITGAGSNGITISAPGTVTVSGGTVKGETFGIDNSGVLYLSGSPVISNDSNGNGDILHEDGSVYAVDQTGAEYTGGPLNVRVFKAAEDKVVVYKVSSDNKDKFILVNTPGYVLKQSGENLVLGLPHAHSWSAAWSKDGDYHWHECEADDCDVTENSQKGGYEEHIPNTDGGNCLIESKCTKCGFVITPAKAEHSFTNRVSQALASEADCQNRARYYVQCDNCNVVSDTLTIEVGELGDHDWDTEWSKDGDNHWHKCLIAGCAETEGGAEHFSTDDNMATYTKQAICDQCGTAYGDVVPDNEKPTGTIAISGDTWREFTNTITFGIFYKDTQTVALTASDVGLGIDKAEYILTETVYADVAAVLQDTGIAWSALTLDADRNAEFSIVPNEKGIVYLKITDKAGNVTVIRSDKITIDNIAPVIEGIKDRATYCGPVEVTVIEEHIAEVAVNGTQVTPSDGKFVVMPADGLQKIKVTDKAGNATEMEIIVNDGHDLRYSADGNWVHESCDVCHHEAKASIGIVGLDGNNSSKVYDGQAVEYEIRYEGNFLGKDELIVEFEDSDGAIAAAPVNAGQYSVQLSINGLAMPASYTFYILPKSVALPEINSKVYTGETLTADIQNTDLYTVTANEGGTDVGLYNVTLTLKDAANYRWAGFEEASVTVKFAITKATNEWVGEPYIESWQYGEGGNEPVATAKFGTIEYTFYDAEGNELTGVPVDAGDYTVKVVVPATDNYTVLSKKLPFTIGKRLLSVKWTEPDSLVYDGTAKMPYAEYASGATNDDEPQIRIVLTEGLDNVNTGTFTFTATGVDDSNYELTGVLVSPEYTITARPLRQSDFAGAIDGLVYTGSAITPAVESTTPLVAAEDYTVAYESNVDAGENTAKIVITGKRNATGSVEILFSIAKADYPVVWLENLVGNHGDKLSTVTLTDGLTWDDPEEMIQYGNGHKYAATYTPKDTDNYKVTHGFITVNGADVTAPTGTVTIGENSWNTLWNDITFGLFFKETQTVTVTAEDTESGITKTEYYLAAADTNDFADVRWTAFEGSFDINPNNKYVVYIRMINGAGYETIINSDGVVLDNIVPVISGIENGKDVYGDAAFTVDEEHLASVTVDGTKVDAPDGKYAIPADNAEHTVVVTDKSGNSTRYRLTVYKTYTVTFVADGKEITKLVVGHGKAAELPEIPAKDGYTAKWDADGKSITADTTITAEYTPILAPNTPQTGDNSPLLLWMTLMLISMAGLVTAAFFRRRRQADSDLA